MTLPEHAHRWLRLRRAACLAFVVHLLAGLAMALVLRQGLDTNTDLDSRFRFLADHTFWWVLGWLTWNAAALTILWFFLCFALAHAETARPRTALWIAVLLTTAGVALDLGAEAIEMGMLPGLAAQVLAEKGEPAMPPSLGLFLHLHRAAVMLTGYAANGLYSISALLLAWTTRREYRIWEWPAGMAVGFGGLGLSLAVLVNSVEGMVLANGVLGPCLLYWLGVVALRRLPEVRH